MTVRDAAMLVALASLWGASFLFIRVAVPSFGPAALVAARVALGALLLWGATAAWRHSALLRPFAKEMLVLGAINAAVPYTLISAAELELTASFAAVLNATTPLFAAVFGAAWLDEGFTVARALGLVTGIGGVGVMMGWSPVPLTHWTVLAVGAMLAGSASYAGAGVYVRLKLDGVAPRVLAFGQQLGALAWLAVPAVVWTPRSVPPVEAMWAVLALGLFSTALAYLLYFRLLERVGPTRTTTVTYLIPAFGLLWGVVFLDEPVTGGMVTGFGLILASMILINRVGHRPAARPERVCREAS